MSLKQVQKELKHLSYSEMMLLAKEVSERLTTQRDPDVQPNVIAEILTKLDLVPAAPTDLEQQEEKLLRKAFSRKRTLSVQCQPTSWSVDCPTVPGSQVIGSSLRQMFPLMLDQIITMQALTGDRR